MDEYINKNKLHKLLYDIIAATKEKINSIPHESPLQEENYIRLAEETILATRIENFPIEHTNDSRFIEESPIIIDYGAEDLGYMCPNCNSQFQKQFDYCPNCGQALKWRNTHEEK